MKFKLYVETSIVSYLAARPSRDLVTAAHQQITHDWWNHRRGRFEIYASQLVLEEAARGDKGAAERRLSILEGMPFIEIDADVAELAEALIERVPLPTKAGADAAHIAAASCHGIDFLPTWNCAHIANAELRPGIERVCRELGFSVPVLCTPDELLGEAEDD